MGSSQNLFFQKKFAVVTGGSEGIGLAAATGLAELGANVFVCARDSVKLARALEAMEKMRTHAEQRFASAAMDVADFSSVRQQMEGLVRQYGTPDILINSAGFAHPGYLEDVDVGVLRGMMEVNYFGTLHTVKALLPSMQQARRGHIVNISSMAGYLGLFGYSGYCASKYAVIGFSSALRHELKPHGITVSVLCPPNTRTPGLDRENKIKPKELLAMEERIKTLSSKEVVNAMFRAIPKRSFMINPSFNAQMAYLVSRLAPTWMADFILRRPVLQ